MERPFTYGKVVNGDYFTNRKTEQKRLVNNFLQGINSILISPRRYGKSSLVRTAADVLRRKHPEIRFAYIDLFNVQTEEEFLTHYAAEVLKAASSGWDETMNLAKKIFKVLVPRVSMNIDQQQEIAFSFDWKELKKKPDEILDLAETVSKSKKIRVITCIDEFQKIASFPNGAAIIQKLRAHWQLHEQATYCLYGSKRHIMTQMFEKQSMPFYKFGDIIFLEKISRNDWVDFIVKRFTKTGKKISPDLAGTIADQMENHPYFVQQLAQEVWTVCDKSCKQQDITTAMDELLTKNNYLYQQIMDDLTAPQINFLKAFVQGEEKLSAAEALHKFHLGSSGNVNRIKEALEKKEIIERKGSAVELADPLFRWWLLKVFLK